jgi:hypothetical protein
MHVSPMKKLSNMQQPVVKRKINKQQQTKIMQ